jgi:hypothetical protein
LENSLPSGVEAYYKATVSKGNELNVQKEYGEGVPIDKLVALKKYG